MKKYFFNNNELIIGGYKNSVDYSISKRVDGAIVNEYVPVENERDNELSVLDLIRVDSIENM